MDKSLETVLNSSHSPTDEETDEALSGSKLEDLHDHPHGSTSQDKETEMQTVACPGALADSSRAGP